MLCCEIEISTSSLGAPESKVTFDGQPAGGTKFVGCICCIPSIHLEYAFHSFLLSIPKFIYIYSSSVITHIPVSDSAVKSKTTSQKIELTKSEPAVAPAPKMAAFPSFSPSFLAHAPCCTYGIRLASQRTSHTHIDVDSSLYSPSDAAGLQDDSGPAPPGRAAAC